MVTVVSTVSNILMVNWPPCLLSLILSIQLSAVL
jgi:hypothetical protein